MRGYRFRIGPELFWIIVTAAVIALAQVLLTFQPESVADWRLWAVSLLGAVARAVAAAVIAALSGEFIAGGDDESP